jgi:GTPase
VNEIFESMQLKHNSRAGQMKKEASDFNAQVITMNTKNSIVGIDKATREDISKIKESDDFKKEVDKIGTALSAREDNDVRIAVIGNVDSGKSTMVGCLTRGIADDGRGSARQKVFNFSHEAANGRTSSIGQEILGFNEDGK